MGKQPSQSWDSAEEFRAYGAQQTTVVYNQVKSVLEEADFKMRFNSSDRAKTEPIKVGDRVYMACVLKPGVARKLQPRYSGPFRVIKVTNEVIITAKCILTGRIRKLHADKVKVVRESLLKSTSNPNVRCTFPTHVSEQAEQAEQVEQAKQEKQSTAEAIEGEVDYDDEIDEVINPAIEEESSRVVETGIDDATSDALNVPYDNDVTEPTTPVQGQREEEPSPGPSGVTHQYFLRSRCQ